jgi:hypothetical protein
LVICVGAALAFIWYQLTNRDVKFFATGYILLYINDCDFAVFHPCQFPKSHDISRFGSGRLIWRCNLPL